MPALWGVPVPGGCLVWGDAWSVGVPGRDPLTVTAVGSTHPTGVHSCFKIYFPFASPFVWCKQALIPIIFSIIIRFAKRMQ